MMGIRQGRPRPHGVRLVIGIHEGFLLGRVGHVLFKNMADDSAFTAIVRDPI